MWLSAYVDGELEPGLAVQVQAHLQACPHCHQQFAVMSQVSKRYQMAVYQWPVPGNIEERVWTHVFALRQRQQITRLLGILLVAVAIVSAFEVGLVMSPWGQVVWRFTRLTWHLVHGMSMLWALTDTATLVVVGVVCTFLAVTGVYGIRQIMRNTPA
jgi:predicted anti-sigma-YlaC factor YlaD